MSIVSYDSSVAREAETALQATAGSLEGHLADLGGFVTRACADWEGDEQVVYRGIQAQWDQSAAEITTILRQITAALATNTGMVDQMRSRVRSVLGG